MPRAVSCCIMAVSGLLISYIEIAKYSKCKVMPKGAGSVALQSVVLTVPLAEVPISAAVIPAIGAQLKILQRKQGLNLGRKRISEELHCKPCSRLMLKKLLIVRTRGCVWRPHLFKRASLPFGPSLNRKIKWHHRCRGFAIESGLR